jgi:D-cysteine desulfhydrase
MSHSDHISQWHPKLGERLGKEALAALPTPVRTVVCDTSAGKRTVHIKCDDLAGDIYGGNKVRKLEYALWPALNRGRKRVATFGAVGSNHALATALYAHSVGLGCTCFLSHQRASPDVANTLHAHLANKTEIVRYGGAYAKRIATLRKHLWNRDCWVIPAGGSSWLGTVGFVNAGLELAAQIDSGEIPEPDRIYIATGTMGSAVGLAIGLAMADIQSQVEAVRVSMRSICNEQLMHQLLKKTIAMMNRLDETVSKELISRTNIRLRHLFFAGGYAHRDADTDNALKFASEHLDLRLDGTYTGKAMAALLSDAGETPNEQVLFWNTYNSKPLSLTQEDMSTDSLPEEFRRYYALRHRDGKA